LTAAHKEREKKMKRIKLVCRNPITRKFEEVHPEDEFDPSRAIPFFHCHDGKYYSIPDVQVSEIWNEWLAQEAS